jgi:hypothetical protein
VWPTIVAESLGPVAVPLATALVPGAAAPPPEVVAALARSLAPPEADAAAPHWLWPSQQTACRRVIAAMENHGGALLADPVGTGKTYVALATAARFNAGRRTTCLIPASLRDQWVEASRRTGVSIVTWTHQQASRGRLPPHSGRLVVIDESHRFRNPETRGYGHVAPWLLGHRVLLLSATPVVNRLEDLAHQLALAVRDDTLAPHGVASIGSLLSKGTSHPALGLLVLVTPHHIARPRAAERTERPGTGDDALERWLTTIDRLTLSRLPAVAALLRTVFWRAAGSSAAALLAALRRYRRLLLHARDAHAAGRQPGRGALVQLTEGLSDQLLLWDLLPEVAEPMDLALTDLPKLHALIADADCALDQDDPKLTRLRSLLADGRSTLVFSISRETVRWLRDRLGSATAWCTGDRAGIGRNQAPRRSVLGWFAADARERRSSPEGRLAPRHLIATDVAAEGLDLQGAERVVHYDLPWTPMRLEQRRGRVVRAGSPHGRVEVVRFEPCSAIEQRLRQAELLLRKARLPAQVGLAGEREGSWRWRAAIALRFEGVTAVRGVAAIAAGPPGLLAGFTIHPWRSSSGPPLAAEVLWWDTASGWVGCPALLERRLDVAAEAPALVVEGPRSRQALEQLGHAVRERLRTMRSAAWQCPPPGAAARTVLSRLNALACAAARARDPRRLALLQRAIAFAAGGHTAGEQRALRRLAGMADQELLHALSGLPAPTVMPSVLEARVTGVILFLGETTFPPCRRFARSSSTSMER